MMEKEKGKVPVVGNNKNENVKIWRKHALFRRFNRRDTDEERHCGCDFRLCEAAEKGQFLFWPVSLSQ